MSIARQANASSKDTVSFAQFTSYYIARPHLSFNADMWSMVQHTEGDNAFSFFKYMTGFHTFTDNFERREYWDEGRTGIAPHIFYTFIGDWYMDLGAIGTLLFLTLLAILASMTFARNTASISLVSLYIFYIYCAVVARGWTFLSLKSFWATLLVLANCMLIYMISSLKRQKNN